MSDAAAPRHVPSPATTAPPPGAMSHKEIMETLSGLLLGMFVAILSSTVVSNALPTIVHDLGGGESGYTWVVTATLLATTISTPIWGKLSDLFPKKLLVQLALVIFVASSVLAGLSQNMGTLITMRVFQGVGAGGLTSLSQVIIATIIAPRERGRYSGYLGATFALGTVAGPLVGGVITDHLSWRWCFYVGVPFAVLALVVLQKTLHLPTHKREVHIDYLGALLLSGGVSSLLIWVSLAGDKFDWWSWQTAAMTIGGVLLLGLTAVVESRVAEPLLPLRLFRNNTIVLSAVASLFVGVGMFSGTVFLSQYFQLARGESPTASGLLTLPMILGLFVSSTVSGQVITRTGRWKAWLCAGGLILAAGLGLMATVKYDTAYAVVACWMALVGLGIGMMMQNLVLAAQNEVPPSDLGVTSSLIAFTRSMGGAIGVSALGAVLAHRVKSYVTDGLSDAHINPGSSMSSGGIPNIHALPQPVRGIVQSAYGNGVADVFLAAAPFALIAFFITLFIKETKLRTGDLPEPGVAAVESVEDVDQVWNTPADHHPEQRLTREQWLALERAESAHGSTAAPVGVAPEASGESRSGSGGAARGRHFKVDDGAGSGAAITPPETSSALPVSPPPSVTPVPATASLPPAESSRAHPPVSAETPLAPTTRIVVTDPAGHEVVRLEADASHVQDVTAVVDGYTVAVATGPATEQQVAGGVRA